MNLLSGIVSVLLAQPLLLGFALTVPAWFALRHWPEILSAKVAGTVLALLLVILGGMALGYLALPTYFDHIEPNTAIVSWLFLQGEPVYHAVDSAERYAFLYGPMPYIANGVVYAVLGGSIWSSKVGGALALLATLGLTTVALTRVPGVRPWQALTSLAFLVASLLLYKHYSFWNKPDSWMLAFAALGLWSCTLRDPRWAAIICGLALGGMVNSKLHGVAYFMPLFAWLLQRHGWGLFALACVSATASAFLPFLLFPNISLANYLAWVQLAGAHGISGGLLVINGLWLGALLLPLLALNAAQVPQLFSADFWRRCGWLVPGVGGAFLLVWLAASKPGSGVHHFLPFAPLLAMGLLLSLREASDRPLTWAGALAAAGLAAILLKSLVVSWYGVQLNFMGDRARAAIESLDEVLAEYPEASVQMGYGDGSSYPLTFVRPYLVFAGNPYLLDASAMMDFDMSGVDIPAASLAAVADDDAAVWLIPAGQEPFALDSWYFAGQPDGQLFSDEFRSTFNSSFQKAGTTGSFDVWVRR